MVQRVLPLGKRLVSEADRRYTDYQCGGHKMPYLANQEICSWLQEWAHVKVCYQHLNKYVLALALCVSSLFLVEIIMAFES